MVKYKYDMKNKKNTIHEKYNLKSNKYLANNL